MARAAQAADSLLNSLGLTQPGELSVEEIAWSLGIVVRSAEIDGAEGRILINGDQAVVTVNKHITHPGKRNFVLAHEIGHFCLHKNLSRFYSDTEKNLFDWYSKGAHEAEANSFASELLMPSQMYIKRVQKKKLSIAVISEVAEFFQVSLTAAFLKYTLLGDFPLMIMYIENGRIKWKKETEDFPFKWLQINSPVPVYTVAGDLFYNNVSETSPVKVEAIEWFPNDFKLRKEPKWMLWEQCFRVGKEGIMSCLWAL